MSRTIAIAVLAGALSSMAVAAPARQLTAPNFNPGLKTVPSVPHTYYAALAAGTCEQKLATRIDSGTVIAGADGRVAHLTGMAAGAVGSDAQLVITSTAADGLTATADFMACITASSATPSPVAASMPIGGNSTLKSISVRAESNAIVLDAAAR
jgi:hypothetical protein